MILTFFLKTGNLIIYCLLLSDTTCRTQRSSSPFDKLWSQMGKFFSELWKIWKYNLCFSKIPIFHLFQKLEKTWKHTQPKANIWKSKFRIYGKVRNKLCPNLSLNVENKMENSHKKGWSHFKLNINDSDIYSLKY